MGLIMLIGTIKQIADSLSKLATLAPKLKILTLKGKSRTIFQTIGNVSNNIFGRPEHH
jgi:hypothetical protein